MSITICEACGAKSEPNRPPDRTKVVTEVNFVTECLQEKEYRYWDEPSGLFGAWRWLS